MSRSPDLRERIDETLFCCAADRGDRHVSRFARPTTSHRLDPLTPPQVPRLLFQDLPCQHRISRIRRGKISDRSLGGLPETRVRRTSAGCDLEFTQMAMSETVALHIDNFGHLDEIGEGLRPHGSLTVGDCVCRRVFRPKPPGASICPQLAGRARLGSPGSRIVSDAHVAAGRR